ncbi:hypothetical protein MRX96_054243 [Rhipicephalus microplus]
MCQRDVIHRRPPRGKVKNLAVKRGAAVFQGEQASRTSSRVAPRVGFPFERVASAPRREEEWTVDRRGRLFLSVYFLFPSPPISLSCTFSIRATDPSPVRDPDRPIVDDRGWRLHPWACKQRSDDPAFFAQRVF